MSISRLVEMDMNDPECACFRLGKTIKTPSLDGVDWLDLPWLVVHAKSWRRFAPAAPVLFLPLWYLVFDF